MAKRKVNYAEMFTMRSDGRYQGYYRDANGKRHAICDKDPETLFRRIESAKNWIEESKNPDFKTAAEAWREKHFENIRGGTQTCYAPALKRAIERFGDRKLGSIEPYEIRLHLDILKQANYSAKTISTQRTVYNLIFQYAITDKEFGKSIQRNPVDNVKLPDGLPKPEQREVPDDDIIKKIRENCDIAYFGCFALLLIYTGFRKGEALGLQWQDIDFKNGIIYCRKQINYAKGDGVIASPKTRSGVRSVPMLMELEAALRKLKPKGAKPTDFLFYEDDPAEFVKRNRYQTIWRRYCSEAGLVKIEQEVYTDENGKKQIRLKTACATTAHCLRHYYATILMESGVDEFTMQSLVGHSDAETTRRVYIHLRNKQREESIQKLRDYIETSTA